MCKLKSDCLLYFICHMLKVDYWDILKTLLGHTEKLLFKMLKSYCLYVIDEHMPMLGHTVVGMHKLGELTLL